MRSLIAAIDLGTTNIICLVGEKIANQIKIISCNKTPSNGIVRGDVVNIQNVLDCILPVKQNIEGAIGYKINEVFISTGGRNIKCVTASTEVTRKEPEQIITEAEIETITRSMYNSPEIKNGEVVLHAIPQSYNIDDFMGIVNPVGMTGSTISANFKLFIGKENSINLSKSVISRAELITRGIVLEPLATATAVVTPDEAELGVAVVNIGGGTTDVLVMYDNIVRYAAIIPFGGNSITEDIKTGCSVTAKIAEKLKIEYGACLSNYAPNKTIVIPGRNGGEESSISFKMLANIIGARTEELLEAVKYEIEKSGYYSKLKGGIILTGGGANLVNIVQLTKMVTGLNAKIGSISSKINCSEVESVIDQECSTAVGIVIEGFRQMEKDGTVYNTATMIDYSLFNENENTTEEKEDVVKENENEKKEEKKKKFSFKKVIKQITNNEMFKENEA